MKNKFLAVLVSFFLCGLCLGVQAKVVTINQATIHILAGSEERSMEQRSLPFRWDSSFPGENGSVQYTITLPPYPLGSNQRPYALFIPKVGNQILIYINGYIIDAPSDLDDTWHDSAKEPVFATVPAALLRSDSPNLLVIKTSVQALRWGGMSEIYYGPESELQRTYLRAYWWQQASYIILVVALFLMGTIAWALWLSQREGIYGLFALSAMWGGFSTVSQISAVSWLPWPLQGIGASVALAWHIVFMTRFTLGIVGRTVSWVRLTLLATSMAIGIAFVLAEPVYWTIAFAMLCLPMVVALICTAQAADRDRSRQARFLFAVSLIVALTALRDFFVLHWPESGMSEYALLPHALFLYVLMMGWILVERYTQQHRQYHELNITLEERVAAREKELATSFETIANQGVEKAKLLERQRIMSDIHDGVGGQLVGLVNMIKRGEANQSLFDQKQLSEHAQMALDELRVAVDALQPVNGDLATVLATLRYRLAPRLKASDIELVWRVDELPMLNNLTPQKVLQIQRILLEAFTNILKHANAKTATLTAHHCPLTSTINIELTDDGVGFDPDGVESHGHGLRNMRFRAQAIDASITLERLDSRNGMTLKLCLPDA